MTDPLQDPQVREALDAYWDLAAGHTTKPYPPTPEQAAVAESALVAAVEAAHLKRLAGMTDAGVAMRAVVAAAKSIYNVEAGANGWSGHYESIGPLRQTKFALLADHAVRSAAPILLAHATAKLAYTEERLQDLRQGYAEIALDHEKLTTQLAAVSRERDALKGKMEEALALYNKLVPTDKSYLQDLLPLRDWLESQLAATRAGGDQ